MSYEFRMPNLSAPTVEGQLRQLVSFLRQHIQQLNWALRNLDDGGEKTLTQEQRQAAIEAVSQSAEVFQSFYRKMRKKQAQETLAGAGKRTVLEGGVWAEGTSAGGVDTASLEGYTVFVAVCGGGPVLCGKHGEAICGSGLQLTCGDGTLTVTAAERPVTALYAVV